MLKGSSKPKGSAEGNCRRKVPYAIRSLESTPEALNLSFTTIITFFGVCNFSLLVDKFSG